MKIMTVVLQDVHARTSRASISQQNTAADIDEERLAEIAVNLIVNATFAKTSFEDFSKGHTATGYAT